MPRVQLAIYGVITIIILGIFSYMKLEINHLTSSVASLQKEVQLRQTNLNMCKASRDVQTREIESMRMNYEGAILKYNKLLNAKPKVHYKTIYKTIIKDVNISKGDCTNVKKLINNIRNTSFDSL
jgi:hypothetical protein